MFKKKEKTMKEPKEKKVRTMKVGTHKKSVLLLWAVLLASTSFGVYKNFTAIDTHTVHEKEIIQLKLNDTNGIENLESEQAAIVREKQELQKKQKTLDIIRQNFTALLNAPEI